MGNMVATWMRTCRRVAPRLLAGWVMGFSVQPTLTAQAQDMPSAVERLIDAVAQENGRLADSQEQVTATHEETVDLIGAYRATVRHNDALRSYNAQLEELLRSQQQEQAALTEQIDRVTVISREITPLMLRMLGALDELVRVDMPFLIEERSARVSALKTLMNRADVSEAEKFRRVLEAYQIENEYGRTIEAYRDTVDTDKGELTVDVLRIGRLSLLCMSPDGSYSAYWDQERGAWRPLPADARRDLPAALRMARKQGAPDLIRIPVRLPKAEAS